jgi:glycerate kinase
MRVVIAPDSFKECLSASAVAEALAAGWWRVYPAADLRLVPMADGGEGTVEALVAATGGRLVETTVPGPLGEPVSAQYGVLGGQRTAVIEMARASGLPLVPPDRRNPELTTTRGTGELMRHVLDSGIRRMIIGIGGSATNDGGAGMAQALGYRLLDADGCDLPSGGGALARIERIEAAARHSLLDQCEVLVACDVDNPLCGPNGASQVYGPQKGATPEMVLRLDTALRHFGECIETQLGTPVLDTSGAGAAGGLGAGLIAFARGRIRPGVDLVAETCGLADHLTGADLLITGEGRMDAQTAHGKTPAGVARLARAHGVPVLAVAGTLGAGYETVFECGVTAAISICPGPISYEEARRGAAENLRRTAESMARLWQAANVERSRDAEGI